MRYMYSALSRAAVELYNIPAATVKLGKGVTAGMDPAAIRADGEEGTNIADYGGGRRDVNER